VSDDSDIIRAIGRLEGKVARLIVSNENQTSRANNHGERIATLEQRQYGIFLLAGIVGTAILAFVRRLF